MFAPVSVISGVLSGEATPAFIIVKSVLASDRMKFLIDVQLLLIKEHKSFCQCEESGRTEGDDIHIPAAERGQRGKRRVALR